jgi:hypothetical protein
VVVSCAVVLPTALATLVVSIRVRRHSASSARVRAGIDEERTDVDVSQTKWKIIDELHRNWNWNVQIRISLVVLLCVYACLATVGSVDVC